MNKRAIYISFAIVGLLVSGVAFAQSTPVREKADKTAVVTELKKLKAVAYCEMIEGNVDKRTQNFEKQKTKHVSQYQKTQKRVTTLVDKIEAEGKDVTTLRVNLVTFDQLIKKFASDYDIYISELQGTKSFTCGKSEGEFRAKLGIARAQLKVVHDDSVAIRTYWSQTLKPEINALKTVVETPETTTTEGGN